eukprot:2494359-Alexandrium_andersonii.AAC.1
MSAGGDDVTLATEVGRLTQQRTVWKITTQIPLSAGGDEVTLAIPVSLLRGASLPPPGAPRAPTEQL